MEFEGKTFCITGKFKTKQKGMDKPLTRDQISELIKDNGGIIRNSVTGKLDYLIVGDEGSPLYQDEKGDIGAKKGAKIRKAEQLNINIISETELLNALNY